MLAFRRRASFYINNLKSEYEKKNKWKNKTPIKITIFIINDSFFGHKKRLYMQLTGSQDISYSQKFRGKCNVTNFANWRTSHFVFPKYLMENENIKIAKPKTKSEKRSKTNIKSVI